MSPDHCAELAFAPDRLPIIHAYEALGHPLPAGQLATYTLEELSTFNQSIRPAP